MTVEERLEALERQNAELLAQVAEHNKREIEKHLVEKYKITEDEAIFLDVAVSHLNVDAFCNPATIREKAEKEYVSVCRRAGIEPGGFSVQAWAQRRAEVENAEREAAKVINKHIVGTPDYEGPHGAM